MSPNSTRETDRFDRQVRTLAMSGKVVSFVVLGCLLIFARGVSAADEPAKETAAAKPAKKGESAEAEKDKKKKKDPYAWKSMFDGKTLKDWKIPNFGGQGDVYVKNGAIVMEMGSDMTGVTWTGDLLKNNYEVCLEGKRTMGGDFFATTTFPVGEESCSFVVGGWAGTVVGLSCIDWYDASDNETTDFIGFEDNQWYRVRIRVTDKKIECWIDDDQVVDVEREGHKFMIRDEVDLCLPFGVSSWCSEGHLRNLKIRRLKPDEITVKLKKK